MQLEQVQRVITNGIQIFRAGVNVSLGSISLNSNDALNFKAHYKNMKDQKIKVSAGEKEAETGAVTMLQKQLTATASISTANKGI